MADKLKQKLPSRCHLKLLTYKHFRRPPTPLRPPVLPHCYPRQSLYPIFVHLFSPCPDTLPLSPSPACYLLHATYINVARAENWNFVVEAANELEACIEAKEWQKEREKKKERGGMLQNKYVCTQINETNAKAKADKGSWSSKKMRRENGKTTVWKFAKRRRKNKLSKNKCHDAKYTTAAGATTTRQTERAK